MKGYLNLLSCSRFKSNTHEVWPLWSKEMCSRWQHFFGVGKYCTYRLILRAALTVTRPATNFGTLSGDSGASSKNKQVLEAQLCGRKLATAYRPLNGATLGVDPSKAYASRTFSSRRIVAGEQSNTRFGHPFGKGVSRASRMDTTRSFSNLHKIGYGHKSQVDQLKRRKASGILLSNSRFRRQTFLLQNSRVMQVSFSYDFLVSLSFLTKGFDVRFMDFI